jgi:hypothetical protein
MTEIQNPKLYDLEKSRRNKKNIFINTGKIEEEKV